MPANEKNEKSAADEGRLPWTDPVITTFAARDADAAVTYGGVDAGIYHS